MDMSGSGVNRRSSAAASASQTTGGLLRFSSSGSSNKLQDSMKESQSIQSVFTKLDVSSKTLMFEANQTLAMYRKRGENVEDRKKAEEEERRIDELILTLKDNLEDMKSIAEDMSTIGDARMTSPRVVDQAKTYCLCVDTLKSSLRQLQIDFQHVKNSKERQDLFTLSRSPFESQLSTPLNGGNSSRVKRRAGGAAEITSGATEGLNQSRRILMETVQRSSETIGRLAGTSGSIQANQTELAEQNTLIGTSRKLLGKYGKREYTDKILICLALIFFLACVLYVVQKRLF